MGFAWQVLTQIAFSLVFFWPAGSWSKSSPAAAIPARYVPPRPTGSTTSFSFIGDVAVVGVVETTRARFANSACGLCAEL